MKANVVARHYDRLTPEERFCLILAAGARGDQAEQDRLVSAGERITLSVQDHAPYAHAFNEVAGLIFLELLEESAQYFDLLACADDAPDGIGVEDEEMDGGEAEEAAVKSAPEESEAGSEADSADENVGGQATWERYLDMALAAGFVLRTKVEGWKLFCQQLSIPPFVLWEGLPGFDRLRRALHVTERVAFVPEGFLRWLNANRPAGEPERVTVPLTAEGLAAATEKFFRQQVQWWGG